VAVPATGAGNAIGFGFHAPAAVKHRVFAENVPQPAK